MGRIRWADEKIKKMEIDDLDLQYTTPKPIYRKPEPVTIGDYRKIMSAVTGRPMKLICILTSHWQQDWYIQMSSLCKGKDKTTQAKIINAWLRDCRLKAIST